MVKAASPLMSEGTLEEALGSIRWRRAGVLCWDRFGELKKNILPATVGKEKGI